MQYENFKNPGQLLDVVNHITSKDYPALVDNIIKRLRKYFDQTFAGPRPSRFSDSDNSLVRPRFLVGLSGGIDSAVVTYLAVKAVGVEQVLPVTMWTEQDDSKFLSRIIREDLGFQEPTAPYLIGIPSMKSMLPHIGLSPDKEILYRAGNMASRIRVAILYDLQRAIRGRILGTQNRTEFCLGYGAKFGTPSSYDFGVLDDLYKVDIYEIAKVLKIPDEVVQTPPSSGFWPGQTHAEELGASIEEQDAISFILFREDDSRIGNEHLLTDFDIDSQFSKSMLNRWDESHHKRALSQSQPRVRVFQKPY